MAEAQEAGLLWAPLRKPHENALDEHWLARKTFAEIEHPELGRSFRYPTSKWLSNKTSWQVGRRAPLSGEDTEAVLGEAPPAERAGTAAQGRKPAPARRCTTSRSRCRASRSSISPGFSPRPAAPGFSRRWVPKATRSSGRTIPTHGWPGWRRSAAAPRAMPRPGRCRGQGPRHGRQFPQQEFGQARHLAQHPPPQGPADRQGHDPHLRCRGRGVFARRPAAAGARLRRAEVDPARHHLHPAIRDGRARHLWPDAHGRPGRGGVRRAGRDVGAARAGDAGELGLFVSRLDGRLRLRAGAARRDLPPRAHRRGPVDRRLAMRERHLPDRRDDPRLGGQRPRLPPLRQPLAVQAGGAARRLSLRGQGPLDRDRLLHRRRMAGAGAGRRARRLARRPPFRDARQPANASGRARCGGRSLDPDAGPLRLHDEIAEGGGAGRGVPERRGSRRYRPATAPS